MPIVHFARGLWFGALLMAGCHREPDFDQRVAARSARIEGEASAIRADIDLRLRAESAAHPPATEAVP